MTDDDPGEATGGDAGSAGGTDPEAADRSTEPGRSNRSGDAPGDRGDGSGRADPEDRGDRPGRADPEEMSIDQLRAEIEAIDREIVELIARRTYVAETVAGVKAERGLPTTDERQEQRVMERAGENAERFDVDANLVKAIFRLLIELNKVEQRESR